MENPEVQGIETETRAFLRTLLTYDNLHLTQYLEVIREEMKTGGIHYSSGFAEHWEDTFYSPHGEGEDRFNPDSKEELTILNYLKNKLEGQTLIDLGGGNSDHMQNLAKKCRASTYINVDYWHNRDEMPDPYNGQPFDCGYRLLSPNEKLRPMRSLRVGADILDFVSRLPTNSCNFSLNGIDTYVINDPIYRAYLMDEAFRATRVGGIMFGIGTDLWRHHDHRLKDALDDLLPKDVRHFFTDKIIFEKTSE